MKKLGLFAILLSVALFTGCAKQESAQPPTEPAAAGAPEAKEGEGAQATEEKTAEEKPADEAPAEEAK